MKQSKLLSLLAGLFIATTSLWADVVWTDWTESTSLPTNSGNYRLTCDVTLGNTTFTIDPAVIRLDLNGYGICRTLSSHCIYKVEGQGELTIEDSNPTRIGGDNRPEGVYGGYITGGKGDAYGDSYEHGGAIYVYGGTFTMNGGTICGNACLTEGGAVWIGNNGTFIMNGGLLTNNTSNHGGCEVGVGSNKGYGVYDTRGTFIMNGGVIRHPYSNQTGYVSAIRVNEGVMELHGGKIIGLCNLDEDKYYNAIEIYSAFVSTPEERCDFLMDRLYSSYRTLTIKEPLGSNVFGVRPLKNKVEEENVITDPAPRVFTQNLPGNGGISNFVSLDDNYYVILSTDGEGQLYADQTSGDPVIVVPPTSKNQVYNGLDQILINAGQVTGGTMVYSLTSGGEFSTLLPQAKESGTYTVYYKVIGNNTHNDLPEASIEATISPAPLTVGANDQEIYCGYLPVWTLNYNGFVWVDDESVINGTLEFITEYTPTSPAGNYTATPSGLSADNYNITYVPATLTAIANSKAAMTVAPTANDRTYDATTQAIIHAGMVTGGTIQYSLDGVNWDYDNDNLPMAKDAGTYTVYYRAIGDANHEDYTPSPNIITSTIFKAPLVITADDKTIICGEPAPAYTVTYDSFVGGEDESVLGGTLAFACDYTTSSIVGSYPITVSGLSSDNYDISFINGMLAAIHQSHLPGQFSISADQKVWFAPGNLQYQAGTDKWRFATTQYAYVGDATLGNVYANSVKCNNALISETYDGWIDLFGWATSGNMESGVYYQPWATNNSNSEAGKYGQYATPIGGDWDPAKCDWGVVHADQLGEGWCTLTKDEWDYLLNTRANAANLHTAAVVDNIQGQILLPDDWTLPDGLTMTTGLDNYNTNVYTAAQWAELESAGAVFLPAAGYRSGVSVYINSQWSTKKFGSYWTATASGAWYACIVSLDNASPTLNDSYIYRFRGYSVRLVMKGPSGKTPTPQQPSEFAVSPTKTVTFAPGNLQYQASTGTWRFAEHQYDYVGDADKGIVFANAAKCNNALISETYDGWIDLFGWATSGWDNGNRNAYQPYATSQNNSDYGVQASKSGDETFTGDYANGDWGVYNAGQLGEGWGTLSKDEWDYLLNTRANAANLHAAAIVNSVQGCLILPDNWTTPEGLTVTVPNTNYNTNVFNLAQWAELENAGAVFLPVAGYRSGASVKITSQWTGNNMGSYWTATAYDGWYAYAVSLDNASPTLNYSYIYRYYGYSVRLVKEVEPTTPVKTDAEVTTAPAAVNRSYDASTQALITAGTATGGTMKYSLTSGSGYSTDLPTAKNAGTYTVYYMVEGDATHNDVAEASLEVTISKVGLTVTAEGKAVTCGEAAPAYTASYSGFVGGETESVLGGTLAFACDYTTTSAAGDYTITPSGLTSDNYTITFQTGTLTATAAAPAVVTIDVPTHQDPLNSQWYYTTFYHSTQNYALTNDATEAFVADLSGTDLVLTKIAEGEQVIPANTGVIFRKSYSADPVVLAPTDAAGVSFTANNDLKGVDDQTDLTAIDGLTADNCYILSGQADDLSVVGVGFYKVNKSYLKEHKAYVKYVGNPSNAPKRMRFVFEQENTATGMESIQPSDVSCQKVLRDGQLIIIKNGVEYNANGQIVK